VSQGDRAGLLARCCGLHRKHRPELPSCRSWRETKPLRFLSVERGEQWCRGRRDPKKVWVPFKVRNALLVFQLPGIWDCWLWTALLVFVISLMISGGQGAWGRRECPFEYLSCHRKGLWGGLTHPLPFISNAVFMAHTGTTWRALKETDTWVPPQRCRGKGAEVSPKQLGFPKLSRWF
jgi:hypothetical protein